MQFRTPVFLPNSSKKINIENNVFSIGSCFATEMAALLQKGQIATMVNPFGTLFSPLAIENAIRSISQQKIYTSEDLVFHHDTYLSLAHHSQFDSRSESEVLEKINGTITKASLFLQQSNWVIITLGSAFYYQYKENSKTIVANCHKIPSTFFDKKLLSVSEIVESLLNSIFTIQKYADPEVQILFTVSPVRHTKDGMIENQRSKSHLISAVHSAIEQSRNTAYLPVYEIMMDDLRDYRFYKEDMIHPNSQAIRYIFEYFMNSYFSEDTQGFIKENLKIEKALAHLPNDKNDPKYLAFLDQLKEKINVQQQQCAHPIFTEK